MLVKANQVVKILDFAELILHVVVLWVADIDHGVAFSKETGVAHADLDWWMLQFPLKNLLAFPPDF